MGEKTKSNGDYYDALFEYLNRFVELSRVEFDYLIPFMQVRIFEKRTVILQQGDVEDYLSVVIKGIVRKYVNSEKGEVTLQLATEGHVVQSEISFHHRNPSLVSLETIEPTVLISMHYDHVQQALEHIPHAEKLGRSIIMQMFIKKDARYFDQLKKSTRERFLDYMENHPHMIQRVPQKILASYLNIKPETFSRLKHLIRKPESRSKKSDD